MDRKFGTCFFERYAKLTLEKYLGERYSSLVNVDRPDLQTPDKSLGIEVTRAMAENKNVADALLREMAGWDIAGQNITKRNKTERETADREMTERKTKQESYEDDRKDFETILSSGYAYGIGNGRFVGRVEYDYWMLAQPLRRIIESKVAKVGSGFYGDFKEYGLYIFCKDELSMREVNLTIDYVIELQLNLDIRYSTLYLSLLDKLYVCDLTMHDPLKRYLSLSSFDISKEQCREFFLQAYKDSSPRSIDAAI